MQRSQVQYLSEQLAELRAQQSFKLEQYIESIMSDRELNDVQQLVNKRRMDIQLGQFRRKKKTLSPQAQCHQQVNNKGYFQIQVNERLDTIAQLEAVNQQL